ncbi:hypothetical protein NA56DRAFT_649920 [Hyaloscypha hepaticicola]|uniref:Uncharacterized protein n=1 Tax=Hyaloscypha hepaticicola TaxID=2082293 RepID=A0A2J6PPP3_9HELO|nr:hypothetical protein NA56DRAFT_649920 [Hyaloscypha hepaticicola]
MLSRFQTGLPLSSASAQLSSARIPTGSPPRSVTHTHARTISSFYRLLTSLFPVRKNQGGKKTYSKCEYDDLQVTSVRLHFNKRRGDFSLVRIWKFFGAPQRQGRPQMKSPLVPTS